MAVICVGLDWAEEHHDLCVLAEDGRLLAGGRVGDDLAGVAQVHAWLADHAGEGDEVVIGCETDRGLFVSALVAAGYTLLAVNPLAVDRYRDRHRVSGAKSDPGDARVLAELVRTDRHLHRVVAGDSEVVIALKVMARAHKSLIWDRQRATNRLRSTLREYYPAALAMFGEDLDGRDCLAVLALAPSPGGARALTRSKITAGLRKAGRRRNIEVVAEEIYQGLRAPGLEASPTLSEGFAATTRALVSVITSHNHAITALEKEMTEGFRTHPDAEIVASQPGLGDVLGARVLAEFGDDPNRYANARARKNYAGSSPITVASGRSTSVRRRFARNHHLADALDRWALYSLSKSPGARAYYDQLKARHGGSHRRALAGLANRWVGILDHCLRTRTLYDEHLAWPHHHATEIEVAA
jgi:transposase